MRIRRQNPKVWGHSSFGPAEARWWRRAHFIFLGPIRLELSA